MDIEAKQQIYDISAGYEVYRHIHGIAEGREASRWVRATAVEVYLGARYFGVQTTIREYTRATDSTKETTTESARWDPFFGARGYYSFADRWGVSLLADIGGFGIGNAADFSYETEGNVSYRISHPLSVYAGFRVLGFTQDGVSGGASSFTLLGPKFGITYLF